MPYLKIQTGLVLDPTAQKKILTRASTLVARELNKPESYVMVAFAHTQSMLFAGTDAACAYLELKSIGLPKTKTSVISKSLCQLIDEEMHIPAERVYIEFADAEGQMWGWDGGTF